MNTQRQSYSSFPIVGVPIRNIADYSPFGVQLDGRTVSLDNYRYGYQGSEKDDETKGAGNSYTTFFRQLDPRVGRWFSVDPVFQPWQSPYCSMDGNPIFMNDPNGDFVPLLSGLVGAAAGAIYGIATGKSGKEILALSAGGFVAGATLGVGTLAVGAAGGVGTIGYASTSYLIGGSAIIGGGIGNFIEQVIKSDGKVDKDEVIVNMVMGIPDALLGGSSEMLTKSMTKKVTQEYVKKNRGNAFKDYKRNLTKSLRENGLSNRKSNKVANMAIKKLQKQIKNGFEAQKMFIKVSDKATNITLSNVTTEMGNQTEKIVKPDKK